MAFDVSRNEVVMFGGQSAAGELAETWVWTGTSWTRRMPATSPAARRLHAMTYDSMRGEVVLFGGSDSNGVYQNDTWVWNGTTWARRTTATMPAARVGHRMAFDSMRREVVLYGGDSAAETWTWNGTTWTEKAPARRPPARSSCGLTFDSTRNQIVMWGGAQAVNLPTDTWLWDGTTWSVRNPPGPPSPRLAHALEFDALRGTTLLFGGNLTITSDFFDTWSWDGAAWTQRSPSLSPTGRSYSWMTFDAARGNILLFGGRAAAQSNSLLGDTWIHSTLGGGCTTDAECVDSFCTDGVCCFSASCGACATCSGTSPGRCTPVLNEPDPDSCRIEEGRSCSRTGECKAALGMPSTDGAECASGFVVDGVCCATASCGPCQACSNSLKESGDEVPGVCTATKAGLDPHEDCAADEVSSCRNNGFCDGNRKCQLYADGTECGPAGAVCSGAGRCIVPLEGSCDGDHTVIAADGTKTDCLLYKCEGSTCKVACTSKLDCAGDADCLDGKCINFSGSGDESGGGCATVAAHARPFANGNVAVGALIAMSIFARAFNARRTRRGHFRRPRR